MGLHDRIKQRRRQRRRRPRRARRPRREPAIGEQRRSSRRRDPYAELKTRIHHACIAKLGPELFSSETTEDLSERVLRAVTEQLALDRTPLTREERRQIVREITDDILGYGPLEPLLRDDSVTEVMVNALRPDLRRARRQDRADATPRSSTTRTCCGSSTRSSRRSAAASTRRRRWSTRACPTAAASTRSSRRSRCAGPTLTIRKFSRDPYTMDDLISFGSSDAEGGAVPRRLRARAS